MSVKNNRKETIVFIAGPTATGKTRLSIKLAEKIEGEIISCDSMQAYKGMSILSQAPSAADRKRVRHHLAAFLEPSRENSVAFFGGKATEAIKNILNRKKIPIVVGGSGLYIKALVDGLFPSHPADTAFRKKMERLAKRIGRNRLYERLVKVDPEAAEKIHPNDIRRVIRALEIYDKHGRKMSELKAMTKGLRDVYRIKMFALTMPRKRLYEAIDARVDDMFRKGILDEVNRLLKRRISKTASAVLGLKEIAGYLAGEYGLETAKDLLKMNTRRFAKRQLCWFRPDRRIRWIDISRSSESAIIKKIMKEIR